MKTALDYTEQNRDIVDTPKITNGKTIEQAHTEKIFNGVVKVRPASNVVVKDLFCPKWRCVVVLKLSDGSYRSLC